MSAITTPKLNSPEFKADPYPYYARLRAETPVYRTVLPDRQTAWLITRYEDVAAVLADTRLAKDRANALSPGGRVHRPWVPALFRPLTRNMLDLDAPDHTRLRALVHRAFTPHLIERLRERIERLAGELLDAVEPAGRMDLIEAYALPLPVTVIAELLGIPAEDRRRFREWSDRVVSVASSLDALRVIPAVWQFMRYIRTLVARRRAEPADDLISALVEAEAEGTRLDEDELLGMVFLLLVAGYETTVNLIGSGTLALLEHPAELARFRDDPSLARPAVEELLRFTSPLDLATERYAREEITIAGTTIPQGGLVLGVVGSANRDERQFEAPDRLDLARAPNRHLAFGHGVHYCLGAPLARLEGQIALTALLHRCPTLRLAAPPASLRWRRGLFLRGLEHLPVTW